ncbi:3-deoxy-7-phosphoheptulonate synthase [Solimonas marina]|uniref:Phospho-2-dehydro-3-deoxyheptonate aldolase n=1 Tax=Solimonas marina TaxID=2714601 RepID=A0A970B5S8_9GAMM|nr:3-deoxy-7-phosphoheptulonate synthase [Solimonas marina]NKF21905.1 3-deoxy-7-phosphoheptulonate synthase [Solimonas marina]
MRLVTENTRIKSISPVSTPAEVQSELPASELAQQTTFDARREIQDVLHGRDDRLLVIVGPCSIHDPKAALEYASRLKALRAQLDKHLLIVMRVYFEKPRTTVGWKGLINDPDLNDSFDINKGLRLGRQLLLQLNEMGIPAGVEYLDILTPQYLTDLVAWGAIGARTTESQLHRELASALSCPVGFKNGTEGSVKVAVDAVMSAKHPHRFLSLNAHGQVGIFETTGNEDCHVILRGGSSGTNYDAKSVDAACAGLTKAGLRPQVMIDCSHANSSKQHKRQIVVGQDIAHQIAGGDERIIGVMIESHLQEGRQDAGPDMSYGKSITDACIHWDDTTELLRHLANSVEQRRLRHARSA